MHLLKFDLMIFCRHYIMIHWDRSLDKTDRILYQKRWFHLWVLWRFHQKCAFFVILFLWYCSFLMLMYRVVLNRNDFLELQSFSFRKSSAVLFLIYSWSSQYLVFRILSNVFQTWINTLNLSKPFSVACLVLNLLPWTLQAYFEHGIN